MLTISNVPSSSGTIRRKPSPAIAPFISHSCKSGIRSSLVPQTLFRYSWSALGAPLPSDISISRPKRKSMPASTMGWQRLDITLSSGSLSIGMSGLSSSSL